MSDASIATIAGVFSSIVAIIMVIVAARAYAYRKQSDVKAAITLKAAEAKATVDEHDSEVRADVTAKETAVNTKLKLEERVELKRSIDRLYADNADLRARLDKYDVKFDAQAVKYESLFQMYVDLRAENQIMRRELDSAHREIADLQDYRTYSGILVVTLQQHKIEYPNFEDVKKK